MQLNWIICLKFDSSLQMKLFILENQASEFDKITGDITSLIIKICQRLLRRSKLDLVHTALFLFHCQAKVISYHSFDRFMYACAAILIASKLTENMEFYPLHIVKALRTILREKKGLQIIEDQEQKLKLLTKKLFEAQVTIMINIGFDFDIELGIFWVQQWSKTIGDSHVTKKVEEALTSLYQTNVVLFFEPQLIALAALSIVMKNEGINLGLCGWDVNLIKKIQESDERIKEIKDLFLSKKRYIYS